MSPRQTAIIIGNIGVPGAEAKALRALYSLQRAATIPEVARSSKGELSINALYTLFNRLSDRNLAERKETTVDVQGVALKRVFWQPSCKAKAYFAKEALAV